MRTPDPHRLAPFPNGATTPTGSVCLYSINDPTDPIGAAPCTRQISSRIHAVPVASTQFPNSHDVLIMFSSWNVSELLDSLMSATDVETNTMENRMSKKSANKYSILQLRFKLRVPPEVVLAHS